MHFGASFSLKEGRVDAMGVFFIVRCSASASSTILKTLFSRNMDCWDRIFYNPLQIGSNFKP